MVSDKDDKAPNDGADDDDDSDSDDVDSDSDGEGDDVLIDKHCAKGLLMTTGSLQLLALYELNAFICCESYYQCE